jgi:hypothetical protein
MSAEYRVAIVVSSEYAPGLAELSRHRHVWAVRTPIIEAAARTIWDESAKGSLESGVTVFNGTGDAEADLSSILAVVEEHHGEYSHDPPVSMIEVFGVGVTEQLAADFLELGFSRFDEIEDGFIAYREQTT